MLEISEICSEIRFSARLSWSHRASTTITGEIPSPVDVKPGCRFANRCPHVMDVCRRETPELKTLEGQSERLVACHLY